VPALPHPTALLGPNPLLHWRGRWPLPLRRLWAPRARPWRCRCQRRRRGRPFGRSRLQPPPSAPAPRAASLPQGLQRRRAPAAGASPRAVAAAREQASGKARAAAPERTPAREPSRFPALHPKAPATGVPSTRKPRPDRPASSPGCARRVNLRLPRVSAEPTRLCRRPHRRRVRRCHSPRRRWRPPPSARRPSRSVRPVWAAHP